MGGHKTQDGIKLNSIVSALQSIGIGIREGSNHLYIAYTEDSPRPCPIATSIDARRMIVPWVKMHTGYSNANEIYDAFRRGGFRR